MGLLEPEQREAIEAGNAKYRHVWDIGVPLIYGSGGLPPGTIVFPNMIHDDTAGKQRVLDPGQRETEAFNQSLAHPGRMPTGMYSIVCDNSDGLFYETMAGNFWYHVLDGHQFSPLQARLRHRVYILLLDGTWSELDMLQYIGQVTSVGYNEDRREATVTARALFAAYLDFVWSESDGDSIDTGLDVRGRYPG